MRKSTLPELKNSIGHPDLDRTNPWYYNHNQIKCVEESIDIIEENENGDYDNISPYQIERLKVWIANLRSDYL